MNGAQMTLDFSGKAKPVIRRATDIDNQNTYGEDRIEWVWDCPCCGTRTIASQSEHTTPKQIEADARCVYCRKRGRVALITNAEAETSERSE